MADLKSGFWSKFFGFSMCRIGYP